MCKAKCDGGQRCPAGLRQRSERLALSIEKMKETGSQLDESREDASPREQAIISKKLDSLLVRVKQSEQELEDLIYVLDRTNDGQRWLQEKIDSPFTSDEERAYTQFRLAKVREERAVENRFIAENRTKSQNTDRAMEQSGFSESDREDITKRFLNRGMNRLPYSADEANREKRVVLDELAIFTAKVNKLKAEVKKADYLSEEEKAEEELSIEAEHQSQRTILEERVRLAKRKFDATHAGMEQLRKGYPKLVAAIERETDGDRKYELVQRANEIKARMNLAEREIRMRNDERNARSAMRRAVMKAAAKAGADPEAVWNACKSITPVNVDGTPYVTNKGSDSIKKSPTVHLTRSDYDAIAGDVSTMEEYRGIPVKDAVQDLMRKRILANPVQQHGSQSSEEANIKADTRRDGTPSRYRTKNSEKRDLQTYPPLTVKDYEQVKSMATTLEMTPASYMRAMALGERETPFTIQNDRSMRRNWNQKITPSTNYLAAG